MKSSISKVISAYAGFKISPLQVIGLGYSADMQYGH